METPRFNTDEIATILREYKAAGIVKAVVDEQTVEETYRIVQDNYTGNEFGKLEWEAAKRKMLVQPGPNYAE